MIVPQVEKPPIESSTIEVRFILNRKLAITDLENLAVKIKDIFPKHQIQQQKQFEVRLDETGTPPKIIELAPQLRCESSDGEQLFVINEKSVALTLVKQYSGWERFMAMYLDSWTAVNQKLEVEEIARVGVRFINKLPFEKEKIDSQFTIFPKPPENAPQNVVNFSHQVVLLDQDRNLFCALRYWVPEQTNINIDIDVYTNGQCPATRENIEGVLKQARELKNEVFFGCFTQTGQRELLGIKA